MRAVLLLAPLFFATIGTAATPLSAQQATPPPTTAAAPRDWFAAWADKAAWLDLQTCFPAAGRAVPGTVEIGTEDKQLWKDAEAAPGGSSGPTMPRLRIEVYSPEKSQTTWEPPLWHSDPMPLKRGRIAFTLPADAVPVGDYDLRVLLISADSTRTARFSRRLSVFNNTYGQPPHLPFTIRPAGTTTTWIPVAAPPASAPKQSIATRVVRLGSPNRERFPKDDNGDCYARSVHTLRSFDGRLFVGCGDWGANRGPIDIWAYVPATNHFEKEGTVDDEAIDVFRPLRGELYLPGIDAKEDFDFGNLYLRLSGATTWSKRRKVPNGVHILDITLLGDTLYVGGGYRDGTAGFWASEDDGMSWQRLIGDIRRADETTELGYAFRFYSVAALGGGIVGFDQYPKTGLWFLKDGHLDRLRVPLFGDLEVDRAGTVESLEPFHNGLLYRMRARGGAADGAEHKQLFYLTDLKTGGQPVAQFRDTGCGPIYVDGNTVYTLTGKRIAEGHPEFACIVWASDNLRTWRRTAAFTLPGVPSAIARLNTRLYVGIGWDGTTNSEAGTVYRVE